MTHCVRYQPGHVMFTGTGVSGESRQLHVHTFRVATSGELCVNLAIVDETTGETLGTFHLDSDELKTMLKEIIDGMV